MFSWFKSVTIGEEQTGDTPLHLAVIMHDGDSFRALLSACHNDIKLEDGKKTAYKDAILRNQLMVLDKVNNRGWNITGLSVNSKEGDYYQEQFEIIQKVKRTNEYARNFFLLKTYPLAADSVNIKVDDLFMIDNSYQYVLITQADNPDHKKASIHVHLERVKQIVSEMTDDQGKMEFKLIKGIDNAKKDDWIA